MWAQQSGDNTFVPPLVKFSGVLVDSAGKPLTGMVAVTLLRPLRSLIESVEREKTTYEPRHLKGD
jgi:hypothetical protein